MAAAIEAADAHATVALMEADATLGGSTALSGGVLGERYIGGGNSIANAIVFGRITGQQAAQAAGRNE